MNESSVFHKPVGADLEPRIGGIPVGHWICKEWNIPCRPCQRLRHLVLGTYGASPWVRGKLAPRTYGG